MRARRLVYLTVCAAVLFGSPIAASASEIAVDFDITKDFYPDPGEPALDDVFGFTFTVGAEDISVTDLGFWDMGGNGLKDPHPVGIYDVDTEQLVVSATVPSGTTARLESYYRFVTITRTKLTAGKQYVILGYRQPADDAFDFIAYNCEELIVAPFVTYDGQVALNGEEGALLGGLVFTLHPWPDCYNAWFGPDFKADSAGSSSFVVDRRVFYNNSKWDGDDPAANTADDGAIATDKEALLPGGTATFANYTSYSRGINAVIIDIQDLQGTPTVDDFLFRMGNDSEPYGSDPISPDDDWPWAPDPTSITVRVGAGVDVGVGPSDRVTIIWADNAIEKCWLQVTVRATDATGLEEDDVFYFGNAVGESGNSTTDALVNATDEIGARNNPHGPFTPAAKDDVYDYNRDKLVNATDQIIARNNRTSPFTALKLITP